MSTNLYWSTEFSDGVLTGRVLFKKGECSHCHEQARLILVERVDLPAGLPATKKFILFEAKDDEGNLGEISVIGITCGCYGKAMRQIAYVVGIRKAKAKA